MDPPPFFFILATLAPTFELPRAHLRTITNVPISLADLKCRKPTRPHMPTPLPAESARQEQTQIEALESDVGAFEDYLKVTTTHAHAAASSSYVVVAAAACAAFTRARWDDQDAFLF